MERVRRLEDELVTQRTMLERLCVGEEILLSATSKRAAKRSRSKGKEIKSDSA